MERALNLLGCAEDEVYAEMIDVTRHNDVQGVVDHIWKRWVEIASLANNAGISPKRVEQNAPWFSQTSLDEWTRVTDVNLYGPFILIRLLAPTMMKGYGCIINIGSLAVRVMPMIAGPHYASSKAGLAINLCCCAGSRCTNIVNCISPGRVLSDLTGPSESEVNRSALSRNPVGRFGTAEEVAYVATFLAPPMAGVITGTTIDITGSEFAV